MTAENLYQLPLWPDARPKVAVSGPEVRHYEDEESFDEEIIVVPEEIVQTTPKLTINGHQPNSAVSLSIGGTHASHVDQGMNEIERRRDELAERLEAKRNGSVQSKTT